jgi:hypothetical protein
MRSFVSLMITMLIAGSVCTAHGRGDVSSPDSRKAAVRSTQVGFATIVVNGRTLTGPNSAAQIRDGRLHIPIGALARVLGDSVLIDTAGRSVSVLLQTGVRTAFDSQRGHVTENGAVVLSITNPNAIVISPFLDELMLPVELVAALFGVATKFDKDNSTVYITRGIVGIVTQQKQKRGFGEIYLAEYEYNLNRYFGATSHELSLNAMGRLGDGRFNFLSNSSVASRTSFSPRNLTFSLERPNGHSYIAGDLGAAAGLQLIASTIRGGLVSVPLGDITVMAFGGRADSGSLQTNVQFADPGTVRFGYVRDTTIFGATATAKPFDSGSFQPLIVTAGGMRFSGSGRNGNVAAASLNFGGRKAQLQTEVAYGKFKGRRFDGTSIDGAGVAVEASGTYQLTERLSFQGRFARVGANFLAPRMGTREPLDLKAGGVAWSPTRWLTTAFTASTTKRPGIAGASENYVSASAAVSPGGNKPTFYLSHTQSRSQMFRRGEFTVINFSKNFERMRLFANATRVKNIGPASANVQIGTNLTVNEANSVEINQGFGSRRSANGLVEWRTSRLLERLDFAAGLGYHYGPTAGFNSYQKLSANLRLPRESVLQLNYLDTASGPTILVKLRGLLFRKREANSYLNSLPSERNDYGRISGRVFQDIDGNGKYDGSVDKPQPSVKIRVDSTRYVETDANGLFAFEGIRSGDREVTVDLLSVRADLTLLDGGSRRITLEAGRSVQFDFRLVRTGRVAGRVWLDSNGNGKLDEGEMPLSDVRVVTASGRDTLTDSDGNFTVADLPPGEHVFFLDEKTLPEKMVAADKPIAVQSFAGRETSGINLTAIPTPAETKRFGKQN